jgi:hypothetical protein
MDAPTKRNPESGLSKVATMIFVSVGVIIVLSFIAARLLTPNMNKARMAASESSALASVHNVNLGEVTYFSSFNDYALDLSSLGAGPGGKCAEGSTPAHACIIGPEIANPACTGTNWCTQSGYKFLIQGVCVNGKCADYVITATPVDAQSGARNFCSTNDTVLRSETAAPRSAPFSPEECHALPSMQNP